MAELITGNPATDGPFTQPWQQTVRHAGQSLADLSAHGRLTRDLRAVLTHHALFALNRRGIPARAQASLALTAATIVFDQDPHQTWSSHAPAAPSPTTVTSVTGTRTEPTSPHHPHRLRDALTATLLDAGLITTPAVQAAFRAVPREVFLPGVDLAAAYAPTAVVTKRDTDGGAVSSASSPRIVAAMLEQLEVNPGDRILEIGAGTGINAALLTELTGPTGTVTTIDIDPDVTAAGQAGLDAAS